MLSWVYCGRKKVALELSQAGNTSSTSVFSVVDMGSQLQVYAATGLNFPRKIMNTKGGRISFHGSSE